MIALEEEHIIRDMIHNFSRYGENHDSSFE